VPGPRSADHRTGSTTTSWPRSSWRPAWSLVEVAHHPQENPDLCFVAVDDSDQGVGFALGASTYEILADTGHLEWVERGARLSRENTQLRQRLSEHLGDQAWRESGLGPPDDIDRIHRRVTELEQHTAEQRRQLAEREDELDATRATNRELMTRLNRQTRTGATSRATPVADARVTPDDA
jgi:regulator of replication initiation timing